MVRLSKNVVHRAWNSWSAFVALRMHNRTVVSRFLSKIMHHQLRKGKYFKASTEGTSSGYMVIGTSMEL